MLKGLSNLLAVLPAIMLMTFANVIIASVMSCVVFIQLIAVAGWSKSSATAMAILIAIVVHMYLMYIPKIKNYISARSYR